MAEQQLATQTPMAALSQYLNSDAVKNKFNDLLGKKGNGFISSVLTAVNSNKLLQKSDKASIYTAALMAASLDLPVNQSLGYSYIVPYGGKAQFQCGWKGFLQLAMRTGEYKSINVVDVHENQFKSWNPLTEELDADFSIEGNGKIVGYVAAFSMLNGFTKTDYWTKEKVTKHAKKYSKSFGSGPWRDEFDAMARKTVIKNVLSKYGMLSIEMQRAVSADQGVIKDDSFVEDDVVDVEYIDNDNNDFINPSEKAKTDEEARVLKFIQDATTKSQLESIKDELLTDKEKEEYDKKIKALK